MRNLALAYDMIEYGKMRYNMLGNADHWFPGNKAGNLDTDALASTLSGSAHADAIPAALAEAHSMLNGGEGKRLQED